jgi:hypothetical protein
VRAASADPSRTRWCAGCRWMAVGWQADGRRLAGRAARPRVARSGTSWPGRRPRLGLSLGWRTLQSVKGTRASGASAWPACGTEGRGARMQVGRGPGQPFRHTRDITAADSDHAPGFRQARARYPQAIHKFGPTLEAGRCSPGVGARRLANRVAPVQPGEVRATHLVNPDEVEQAVWVTPLRLRDQRQQALRQERAGDGGAGAGAGEGPGNEVKATARRRSWGGCTNRWSRQVVARRACSARQCEGLLATRSVQNAPAATERARHPPRWCRSRPRHGDASALGTTQAAGTRLSW